SLSRLLFFTPPATPEIYPLSLHDALPIFADAGALALARLELHQEVAAVGRQGAQFVQLGIEAVGDHAAVADRHCRLLCNGAAQQDRKSTRLNSSHVKISYAVFCLKKKKKK